MKTTYNRPDDWVYASTKMNGTQPYWPNSIFRVYIKPAAKKIGLTKRIGWHTFRHTFGTILNANGENPKVIQELLRHANLKSRWTHTFKQLVMRNAKRRARSSRCFCLVFAKGKWSSLMDPYWTPGEMGLFVND